VRRCASSSGMTTEEAGCRPRALTDPHRQVRAGARRAAFLKGRAPLLSLDTRANDGHPGPCTFLARRPPFAVTWPTALPLLRKRSSSASTRSRPCRPGRDVTWRGRRVGPSDQHDRVPSPSRIPPPAPCCLAGRVALLHEVGPVGRRTAEDGVDRERGEWTMEWSRRRRSRRLHDGVFPPHKGSRRKERARAPVALGSHDDPPPEPGARSGTRARSRYSASHSPPSAFHSSETGRRAVRPCG
jgi:hypothetical protein